ncbi:MAG: transcription termination factor NusA [Parcubacteria group bacterium]|nr:transcription termination factor NusA [Parcubacteria group bacterium]MCR4342655.1 transcription termination factor NusA [Patescibacteria group bacterium]
MFDLKQLNSALEQLEAERGIPKEKILESIEDALSAAYKKDYGKKGQIIRATFDLNSGKTEFSQVKIVVDESMLKPENEVHLETESPISLGDSVSKFSSKTETLDEATPEGGEETKVNFNPEHHIMIEEARKIKKNVEPGEELIFSLENKDDYGRIAAQTAKQVIIQRIREAERESILKEFDDKQDEIVSGIVQRIENNNVFVDFGRTTGIITRDEQIKGERYRIGERIKALLYLVEKAPRGINIYLSRSHPRFVYKLFEIEVPEIASGLVEVKNIAREAGSRSKIAVTANQEGIDPVGSCVGQRGVRVEAVISELGGEKIDIIEWSAEPEVFIANSLSPAKIIDVEIKEGKKEAKVIVDEDQLSLAIGKSGQNVRLAAKLTGWKLDIHSRSGESVAKVDEDGEVEIEEELKEEK